MTNSTGAGTRPQRCPCTSGLPFADCCGPILDGRRRAATAEALMRSRFTAFAVGDREHLLDSWHPRTRPRTLELDESLTWYRLDIESTSGGTPFDTVGEVVFTAHYRTADGRERLHERSTFEKRDGRWVYVKGVLAPD
jgi:SEC-C motif domain protein